jgi:hypothetical protein
MAVSEGLLLFLRCLLLDYFSAVVDPAIMANFVGWLEIVAL